MTEVPIPSEIDMIITAVLARRVGVEWGEFQNNPPPPPHPNKRGLIKSGLGGVVYGLKLIKKIKVENFHQEIMTTGGQE